MMTAQDVPRLRVLGRPFKPVALGLALNVFIIAQANFRTDDRGIGGLLSIVLALTAGTALVLLCAGWFFGRQRLAEYGLLLTAGVYITRAIFVALGDPWDQSILFSIGAAIIAGGSYLLEATDPKRGQP